MEPAYYPTTTHQWERLSYAHTPLVAKYLEDPKKWDTGTRYRCFTQLIAFTVDDVILEVFGAVKCIAALLKTAKWALQAQFSPSGFEFNREQAWEKMKRARSEAADQGISLLLRPFALLADDVKLLCGIAYPPAAVGNRDYDKEYDNEPCEGYFKDPYALS
jgi:hypothetical protein